MTWFPPERQVPPRAPQQRHDPDQWRHDPGGRGRFPVSTTQILLGIVLLAIAASVAAFCFAHSGDRGLEADIVSPQDGGEYQPGPIIIRIRATGGEDPPRWELSYRALAAPDIWILLDKGENPVFPRHVGRAGLEVLELDEPGDYEMRLIVSNQGETAQRTVVVNFTVTP